MGRMASMLDVWGFPIRYAYYISPLHINGKSRECLAFLSTTNGSFYYYLMIFLIVADIPMYDTPPEGGFDSDGVSIVLVLVSITLTLSHYLTP